MDASAILDLYLKLVPGELFRLLQRELGMKVRSGIFSPRVVMWMMINQRLEPHGTLASSVEQLVQGRFDALLSRCKRVRENNIAISTGGYCQARQRVPKLLINRAMDELIARLRNRILGEEDAVAQRVYLLDGSSLQVEHEPELVEAFPPGRNQHGNSHWPVLRIVVLHDLETGFAERPYWGPMNGRHAVSEQALATRAIQHVPGGSVIVGDRNFGIFATAYNAQQSGHQVVLRLTAARAKSLWGGPIAQEGEKSIAWRATRWDGHKKGKKTPGQPPSWPEGAAVQGRLIACRIGRGKDKDWLYLFTTLSLPAADIVQLYGLRWRVETDLRSLKQTVRLQRIAAKSADMMEKELLMAVMAYNLVRAIMFQAAQRCNIDPRQLSFTYCCNIVLDGLPQVLAAPTVKKQQQEMERIIDLVGRCRLPKRKKRRSYPRAVWGRGYHFPTRRTEEN